jgi:hypothetical protein
MAKTATKEVKEQYEVIWHKMWQATHNYLCGIPYPEDWEEIKAERRRLNKLMGCEEDNMDT